MADAFALVTSSLRHFAVNVTLPRHRWHVIIRSAQSHRSELALVRFGTSGRIHVFRRRLTGRSANSIILLVCYY